jgi:hypothetical protein
MDFERRTLDAPFSIANSMGIVLTPMTPKKGVGSFHASRQCFDDPISQVRILLK